MLTKTRKTRHPRVTKTFRGSIVVCFGYVWRKAVTFLFSWEPANVFFLIKIKAGVICWKHVFDQEILRKWKLKREFFHRITTRAHRTWNVTASLSIQKPLGIPAIAIGSRHQNLSRIWNLVCCKLIVHSVNGEIHIVDKVREIHLFLNQRVTFHVYVR